ncbi:hypothetical protein D1BOALGB6SA_2525 [Olavius sp. associated proteobacterium Delta 1]|nr:hypothetical protein D1BOALGB6SA_2525 [Olavius sp. associated proteobacterium Delta 1]
MNNDNVRRGEFKYFISNHDIAILRQSLKELMCIDKNSSLTTSRYTITSLYFDTPFDTALEEKLSGIINRKKYRIRTYNNNDKVIKFETKTKANTTIFKESELISRKTAENIISGDYRDLLNSSSQYLKKTYAMLSLKKYRPVVIVEYDREAYTLPFGNTRITFDLNLRTYNSEINIFELRTGSIPVLLVDKQIMEIKFDHFLPTYLKAILGRMSVEHSAISKYTLCRRFIKTSTWQDN